MVNRSFQFQEFYMYMSWFYPGLFGCTRADAVNKQTMGIIDIFELTSKEWSTLEGVIVRTEL